MRVRVRVRVTVTPSPSKNVRVALLVPTPWAAHKSVMPAEAEIGVPKMFTDVGYSDPKSADLRVPFVFRPPAVAFDVVHSHPKPPATPVFRQPSVAAFFAKK